MICPSEFGAYRAEPPLLVDLRTPRATYDTFLRALARRQPDPLWRTVHPDLRFYMRRLYLREGEPIFFRRLSAEVMSEGRPARLGDPEEAGRGRLLCPLLRDGATVGVAGFQVYEGAWLLSLLA